MSIRKLLLALVAPLVSATSSHPAMSLRADCAAPNSSVSAYGKTCDACCPFSWAEVALNPQTVPCSNWHRVEACEQSNGTRFGPNVGPNYPPKYGGGGITYADVPAEELASDGCGHPQQRRHPGRSARW